MATNKVASVDGVLIRVGDRIVSLYQLAPVPEGADKDHVKVLVDRGLLVDAPKSDAPDEDHSDGTDGDPQDGPPAKSATKAEWVEYAVAHGATAEDAEASTKDDLIAAYGGA